MLVNTKYKISQVSSFSEVWESSLGGEKSLHATVTLIPNDIICSFGAKQVLMEPNYLSVQVNEHEHIMLNPEFLQNINHSCTPNVFFDTRNLALICLRRIEVSEEITFFYPSTEWSMAQGFKCQCQSHSCLGHIQGAAHLSPDILQRYKLSDYVKQKLAHKITAKSGVY